MSEFAWAAGVFEGEGSVIQRGVTSGGNTRTAAITLGMTDEDVVRRICAAFECGKVTGPHYHANPDYKPFWVLKVTRRSDLLPLAMRLLEFTGERRTAALRELLDNPPDHRRIIAETGVCKHGHDTSAVGLTPSGRCAECSRQGSRDYRARQAAA